MKRYIKIFVYCFLILTSFTLFYLIFNQDYYRISKRKSLNSEHLNVLNNLGIKALDNLDVPVSSIILYNGLIIGNGYNSVLKDYNAGGHAEINAISDALKKVGHENFSALNRDSLILISTFEPCSMCKGALINYRIKNVIFIQEKSFKEHLSNQFLSLKYEFLKRKSVQDTLQKHLFEMHPDYPYK